MIGTIIGWIMVVIIVVVLSVMMYAPFVLSGKISEQEERNEQP
jgi:flagellar basal body-associated protein FliL